MIDATPGCPAMSYRPPSRSRRRWSGVLPYWHEAIVPQLQQGRRVLICAHGNSLRALVKYLDGVSDEAITQLNIPTGIPLVYELDEALQAQRHYYLGDPAKIEAATASVAAQLTGGKSK